MTALSRQDGRPSQYVQVEVAFMLCLKVVYKIYRTLFLCLKAFIQFPGYSCLKVFIQTRPMPAYGRQGLDWIVGAGRGTPPSPRGGASIPGKNVMLLTRPFRCLDSQDIVEENAELVYKLWIEGKGSLYVCGKVCDVFFYVFVYFHASMFLERFVY